VGKKISKKIKVVLDTNILISAFLWQRGAKEIFNLTKGNKIQICVTKEILDEFYRVLNYPKFSSRLKLIGKIPEEIINEFLEIVKFYPTKRFKTIIVKADPSDDKFLSCALSSEASFIISGNKHLLNLRRFKGIPIISPREFLKYFKEC
jgi:putative PIN family toxin of toxin-antitoxin system